MGALRGQVAGISLRMELRPLLERLEEFAENNSGLELKVCGNYLPDNNEDIGPGRFGIWDDLQFRIYLRGTHAMYGNFWTWLTGRSSWSIRSVRTSIRQTNICIDRDNQQITISRPTAAIQNVVETLGANRGYTIRIRGAPDVNLN
jgi:hypothetical protein